MRISHVDGQQPGDPVLAVQAMIKVVETANPPLRLVLGADALQRVRDKLGQVTREVDLWEPTTVGTAIATDSVSSQS